MKRTDIDALARMLDGDPVPETAASADTRALAALAAALESSAAPLEARTSANTAGAPQHAAVAVLPRPEFRSELRASLIEAARAQAAAPPLLTRMRQRVEDATARFKYSTSLAAATGATAMALSGGGVAAAAEQALPNDALYGVKLVIEDARLALISDPVERAQQRLAYAGERLDEAEAVAAMGDREAAQRALAEADESAREAAGELITISRERQDPAVLDVLKSWTDKQQDRMDTSGPLFQGQTRLSLESVLIALDRIETRVNEVVACGQCTEAPAGFDFSSIPSASEPFAVCGCLAPAAAEGEKPAATKTSAKKANGKQAPKQGPSKTSDDTASTGGSGEIPVIVPDGSGTAGAPASGSTAGGSSAGGSSSDDSSSGGSSTADGGSSDDSSGGSTSDGGSGGSTGGTNTNGQDPVGDAVDEVIDNVSAPTPASTPNLDTSGVGLGG